MPTGKFAHLGSFAPRQTQNLETFKAKSAYFDTKFRAWRKKYYSGLRVDSELPTPRFRRDKKASGSVSIRMADAYIEAGTKTGWNDSGKPVCISA